MSRLNDRGQLLSAAGDGLVSLDGAVFGHGGAPQWEYRDGYSVLYNGHDQVTGEWVLLRYFTATGVTERVGPGGNSLAVSEGRWAVQTTAGLVANFEFKPGAVMSLTGTDGRGASGPNGVIALCTDYSCRAFELYAPYVPLNQIAYVPGVAYGLCVLSATQAVWTGGSHNITCSPALPMSRPIVVTVDGEDWLVGWTALGLVAQENGATDGYVLASDGHQFDYDARSVNGELMVAWSTSNAEAPQENVKVTVDRARPRQKLEVPLEAMPVIGRTLFVGWFCGTPTSGEGWSTTVPPSSLPGNCYVSVPSGELKTMGGQHLGWYVAGSPRDTDIGDINRAIVAMRAAHPHDRLFVYWPRQTAELPIGADVIVVELYREDGESIPAFEARHRARVARCPVAWINPQVFTSNTNLTPDVRSIVPVAGRIARDFQNIGGLLNFNGTGRATGYQDHPEVHEDWTQLFAGVTGMPDLPPVPDPVPPVPKPPAPKPPAPKPPPTPTPAFVSRFNEVKMSDTKIVAIQGPGGKFGRMDAPNTGPWKDLNQGWRGLLWDRTTPDDDCKFELSKPDDRFKLVHVATRALLGLDNTKHVPAVAGQLGLDFQFYGKPDEHDRGEYECISVYESPRTGMAVGFVEYQNDEGKYPSCDFAVVTL